MAQMKPTYEVVAKRSDRWWGLTVPDVPGVVSQVRSLRQADEYAREAVAFVLGVEPNSFDFVLRFEVPGIPGDAVEKTRESIVVAEQVQRDAAARSRRLARDLKAAGLSGADAAAVLGVSPQRVSQLTSS